MAIPRTLVIVLWSSIVEDSILVGAEETENGLRIASDGGLRTRGAISNRRRSLATCQTLEVVGGDSPGLYTQDGTSNEAGIFFNEGRSSVMYFRLRGEEDDDDAPEDDDTEDDDTEDDDTEDDDTEDDDTEDDDTEDDDTEDGDTEDDDTEDDDTEDGDTQDDDTEDDDTEDGDPEDDDTQDDDTRDDDTEDDDTEDDDPEDDDTEDDDTENDDTQDDDTEDDDNQDDDTQDDDTEDDNNRRWRRGLSAGGFVRRTRARRLGACVSGYWTIGPVGGGYPQLMVDDCASNPADIKVDEWYIRYCAECDTVDYHGQDPVVDCASSASPPPSSLSPSLTPSTGPATAPALTPSPSFMTLSPSTFSVTASPSPSSTSIAGSTSPSSLTLSPSSMTPSPLALTPSPSIPTSVSSPSSSSSVSTPAPSEGELAVEDDDTEDDDMDDDEDDDVDNAEDDDGPSEDFVVQTPSPVVGEGGCRVLDVEGLYAGLYRRIGTYNNRGDYYTEDLAYNIFFATADETEDTSTSSEANGNDRRTLLSARSPLLDLDKTIHSRGLEECDAGYWIITSTGGGYPFLAVPDCAVNPENIGDSSSWVEIACDGCDATDPSESPTVECATGGDALVPTPSPVAPVGGFSGVGSSLPGGVSTCEEVTVTGARIGEYTVVGEVNDRVELQSSDGDYHIYWGSPAPGLQDRRRRRLSEDSDMEFSGRQGQHGQRGLQSCDGYWYIAPATDLYPAYAVLDCAYHPADITATDWLFLDCEDCDVQNAVPRPDVSCTGAGPNIKRGAPTFDTPAPTVFNVNATIEPDTGVHSTCRSLIVTGDFSGNYTAEGRYRGKLDFFSSDGQFNLYFELAANSRRALQSLAAAAGLSQAEDGVMSEEGQTEWRESEESEGGSLEARRASAIDDMGAALNQVLESRESLAACTAGYWILARVSGDPYPVFGVADCAEHPVDIRAATWLVVTCQSCSVQEAPSFVKPTIACGDGESSLTTSGGTVDPTPAPALPASCNRVYVTGPAPGIYDQRGTQGDRGDFFSVGRLYNLYWVFYAGKPVNRGRRYRKVLSEAEGVSPQKWSEDIGEVRGTSAQGHRSDANLVGSNRDSNSERRLEFCEDGFWLITPRGGGFPFYGTKNCAMHPADIAGDATWNTVQCEGCGSESMNDTISISCNSANYIPQPTPTPSLASGQSPTSDPGSDTLVETSTGVTRGGLRWQTGLVFRPALLAFLSSILMAWVL